MSQSRRRRRNPTYQDLQQQNTLQARIIARLSTNEAFGCLTRQALDVLLEDFPLDGHAAVFWDIDMLKQANDRWGKPESSRRIREAIRARASDCTAGQVFSGDEFIAFPRIEDAIPMAERMLAALHALDMSATFYVTCAHPGETPAELLVRVDHVCSTMKAAGLRDQIHLGYGMEW